MKSVARLKPRVGWLALVNCALGAVTLVLSVAGGWRAARGFVPIPDQVDFATYYLAASVLDVDPAALYDRAALAMMGGQRGVQEFAPAYVYPLLFAGVLRPLARLPYPRASGIWLATNLVLLALCSFVLVRLAGFPAQPLALTAGLGAVFLFPPVQQALAFGQVGPLLLFLCAGSLYLAQWPGPRRAAEVASGAFLALATVVKVTPGLLLPYPVAAERWRLSAYASAALFAILILGILWGGGVCNTLAYFGRVLPSLYGQFSVVAQPINQSVPAFFLRLFAPVRVQAELLTKGNARSVVLAPLLDDPSVARPAIAVGSALILGTTAVCLVTARRRLASADGWALGFGVILLLPLLIVSGAWYHHEVLFLLPIALLVRAGCQARRPSIIAMALLAYLLAVIQRYWNWLAVLTTSAWFVSFGLYSGLLLWASLLYALLSPRTGAPAVRSGLPAAEER